MQFRGEWVIAFTTNDSVIQKVILFLVQKTDWFLDKWNTGLKYMKQ